MRTVAAIFLILSSVSAQAAGAVCLDTSQIQNSDAPNDSTLTLTMKNGQTWHTQLRPACSGIHMFGFSWAVKGGQVCENAEILRVLHTGAFCRLGKFEPGLSAPAK